MQTPKLFSLCKFSVVFSPLFQALKSFVSYNNEIQKKLIALNNKDTWIAHFFRPCAQNNRIYASGYLASERMKFVCAVDVYAGGTVVSGSRSTAECVTDQWCFTKLWCRLWSITAQNHCNIESTCTSIKGAKFSVVSGDIICVYFNRGCIRTN